MLTVLTEVMGVVEVVSVLEREKEWVVEQLTEGEEMERESCH